MKIITFVFLVLTIVASGAFADSTNQNSVSKVGRIKKTFDKTNWEELSDVVTNPSNISAKVRCRVRYTADEKDELKSASQTWQDGSGDCEDFANCIVKLCEAKGYNAWIEVYSERNNSEGHAVAMGEWNGRLWMSSNGSFKFVDTKEKAGVEVAVEMGWHRGQITNSRWAGSLSNGSACAAR